MAAAQVDSSNQIWDTQSYQRDTGFVSAYGEDVLTWLEPQAGERILDLGCGDGVLTRKIVESGADVVGCDASESFVESARAAGLDARLMDGQALTFDAEFDAVFTNAALHWMLKADDVIAGVKRSLKTGGRFVGEFGGFGNVAAVSTAMQAVGASFDRDFTTAGPWFFPTVSQYKGMLQAHGFAVDEITTFARPTPLPNGIRSWLEVMQKPFFNQFGDQASAVYQAVEEALTVSLRDHEGQWFADYVRLRFRASL